VPSKIRRFSGGEMRPVLNETVGLEQRERQSGVDSCFTLLLLLSLPEVAVEVRRPVGTRW